LCVNIGKNQLPINVSAIINGGGIRIGLEDNIYFDEEKKVQASNLQLLERINKLGKLLNKVPFTPKEVREMLAIQIA